MAADKNDDNEPNKEALSYRNRNTARFFLDVFQVIRPISTFSH